MENSTATVSNAPLEDELNNYDDLARHKFNVFKRRTDLLNVEVALKTNKISKLTTQLYSAQKNIEALQKEQQLLISSIRMLEFDHYKDSMKLLRLESAESSLRESRNENYHLRLDIRRAFHREMALEQSLAFATRGIQVREVTSYSKVGPGTKRKRMAKVFELIARLGSDVEGVKKLQVDLKKRLETLAKEDQCLNTP